MRVSLKRLPVSTSRLGIPQWLEDSGLHPRLPRRTWHYAGHVFHVVRETEDEVYLGLRCPTHIHKVFNIGPHDEDDYDWGLVMWRLGEGEPGYGVNSLQQALELGADLLVQECPLGFKRQLDGFFEVETEEEEQP